MASHTQTARGARTLDEILVEEAMHHSVLTCSLETQLADVAHLMAANRVHCIVGLGDVTEGDTRLWGVVSDLDLVRAAATEDVSGRTAGGTAATEVVTVAPRESLRRAAELMTENRVSHLLVVEPGADHPLGIVSTLDIAAALAPSHEPRAGDSAMRVEELMSKPVVTISPELPLRNVAALLVRHRISGAPVVRDDEILGVVSEADIIAKERGERGREEDGLLAWLLGGDTDRLHAKLTARSAADAMSSPAVTIEFWRSPSAAAATMLEHGVKRLPVVQHGKLVGIVTRRDLVRAFARDDEAIARDIREGVIRHAFWIQPSDVQVDVEAGEVTLRGVTESEVVRDALVATVRRVPGVVTVHSELAALPEDDEARVRFRWFGAPKVGP